MYKRRLSKLLPIMGIVGRTSVTIFLFRNGTRHTVHIEYNVPGKTATSLKVARSSLPEVRKVGEKACFDSRFSPSRIFRSLFYFSGKAVVIGSPGMGSLEIASGRAPTFGDPGNLSNMICLSTKRDIMCGSEQSTMRQA